MFGNHFYWASLRKINAVFGDLFNNISIQRTDGDGNVVKTIRVPIEQAQKEGYLVRLNEEAKREDSPKIAITLPRLSYEFTGMGYRAEDKMQTTGYIRTDNGAGNSTAKKMYNPVPYDVAVDLSMYVKHIDDGFQILEQILPYFGPHLALTINEIPEMDLKNDITIRLDGFDTTVDYEGQIGDDRVIIWTMNFTVQTRLFHPTSDPAVIKKVIENIGASNDPDQVDQRITQTVNPITADENDVYTIDVLLEERGLPTNIFTKEFSPDYE